MKYRLAGFILCMAVAMLVTTAHAAGKPEVKPQPKSRFTVVQGKGWSVCESYARFLNSQPTSEPLPLCHLKLSPDLTEPDWEEIDVPSHLQMVHAIENPSYPEYFKRLPFDEWKVKFDKQLKEGHSPRLRRTHLALVEGGPVEAILAYEADRNECDNMVRQVGFSANGEMARLMLWNEPEQKIEDFKSAIAFSLPGRLLLFQGKPLWFQVYWQGEAGGDIDVRHFFATHSAEPYGNKERCSIHFELSQETLQKIHSHQTAKFFKRMTK